LLTGLFGSVGDPSASLPAKAQHALPTVDRYRQPSIATRQLRWGKLGKIVAHGMDSLARLA